MVDSADKASKLSTHCCLACGSSRDWEAWFTFEKVKPLGVVCGMGTWFGMDHALKVWEGFGRPLRRVKFQRETCFRIGGGEVDDEDAYAEVKPNVISISTDVVAGVHQEECLEDWSLNKIGCQGADSR